MHLQGCTNGYLVDIADVDRRENDLSQRWGRRLDAGPGGRVEVLKEADVEDEDAEDDDANDDPSPDQLPDPAFLRIEILEAVQAGRLTIPKEKCSGDHFGNLLMTWLSQHYARSF